MHAQPYVRVAALTSTQLIHRHDDVPRTYAGPVSCAKRVASAGRSVKHPLGACLNEPGALHRCQGDGWQDGEPLAVRGSIIMISQLAAAQARARAPRQ